MAEAVARGGVTSTVAPGVTLTTLRDPACVTYLVENKVAGFCFWFRLSLTLGRAAQTALEQTVVADVGAGVNAVTHRAGQRVVLPVPPRARVLAHHIMPRAWAEPWRAEAGVALY